VRYLNYLAFESWRDIQSTRVHFSDHKS